MKITLNVNYRTRWGEQLYVCGNIPELGNGDPEKAAPMNLADAETWQLRLNTDASEISYSYIVKSSDAPWRFEWGEPHTISSNGKITEVTALDAWQDTPSDKPYFSSAFTDGMLRRSHRDQPLKAAAGTLRIAVLAPMVEPDEILAVTGEGNALGNWDPRQAIRLNDARYPLWEANIPLRDITRDKEYKFLIIKKETGEAIAWERRDNRRFPAIPGSPSQLVTLGPLRFVNPRDNWRAAGTAIPVFSIRTDEDFGTGDFFDIKKMVDWCVATGQKILQLLPVNDTSKTGTWVDSYPYSACSSFALHPMYLRLEAVGTLRDKSRREYYRQLGRELNALAEIDYERVNSAKHQYLREIFREQGKATLERDDFKKFVEKNSRWLMPYAAWSTLRDQFHTCDTEKWGEYARFSADVLEKVSARYDSEMQYHLFLQYHLDRQLREARDYAHQNGVVLKGDLPIGVGRQSADTWTDPRLFNMDCQAGAPPDDFSVLGQNWGFPTYNWDEMARDGFRWWKERFQKMAEYFDAYRIDHILGFFRIWQIPDSAIHGLLGYFNPALPFSPEELRGGYDFWINPDVMCRPLILEWMLTDFFGKYSEEAKSRFLDHLVNDRYTLKPFVDTQVKVAEYFAQQEPCEKNQRLCDALMGLIDNVLFIEDPYRPGTYHPRISAQFSYQYRVLDDHAKNCFNRLYNDFFYHRHNDFWRGKALWKLPPLLDSTSMLTCAEDLGMIPACVPEVMHTLQILSLEIQRMPKDPKVEFGQTWHYPYWSVCTTSTHDMPGIRGWWESDHAMAQRFFNHVLGEHGEAPFYAEPWICDKIIDLHLDSPSMLCILPLQDWLSIDASLRRQNPAEEVINVPANSRHYWRYRMHLTVEHLLGENSLNSEIANQIKGSGR